MLDRYEIIEIIAIKNFPEDLLLFIVCSFFNMFRFYLILNNLKIIINPDKSNTIPTINNKCLFLSTRLQNLT